MKFVIHTKTLKKKVLVHLLLNPVLVMRYPCVDSWKTGISTGSRTEGHNTHLHVGARSRRMFINGRTSTITIARVSAGGVHAHHRLDDEASGSSVGIPPLVAEDVADDGGPKVMQLTLQFLIFIPAPTRHNSLLTLNTKIRIWQADGFDPVVKFHSLS